MTNSAQNRHLRLQVGGAVFALCVGLWGLRDISGGEMIGTIASFATGSHQETLVREVTGLLADTGYQRRMHPAVRGWAMDHALPASINPLTGKLSARLPAGPVWPARQVARSGFPVRQLSPAATRNDRPPVPPPRSAG